MKDRPPPAPPGSAGPFPEILCVLGADGVCRRLLRVRPHEPEELVRGAAGRPVGDVLPPPAGKTLGALLQECLASGASARDGWEEPGPFGWRRYEAIVAPDGSGTFLAVVRDVTEARREGEVSSRLHEFDRTLLGGAPPETALGALCDAVARSLRLPEVWVELDASNGKAARRVGTEPCPERHADAAVHLAPLVADGEYLGNLAVWFGTGRLHFEASGWIDRLANEIASSLVLARKGRRAVQEEDAAGIAGGFATRPALDGDLLRAVDRARRGYPSTLLLVDLDNFKSVNDAIGHVTGDLVLEELAGLLRDGVRPGDEVARIGGDEFVVLLEGIPVETGRLTAERLRHTVDEHRFSIDGRTFDLGISIGAVPVDGRLEPIAILAAGESALHSAKESGRNRVVVADTDASRPSALSQASTWASRIKEALREDRLVLCYQPVVRLVDGVTEHFEALVRMTDPASQELILPGAFLPAAQQFGLMPQIDSRVVDRVLDVLRVRPDAQVFVNLSGASVGHETFLGEMEERIRTSGIRPGQLCFEITETTAVRELDAARMWMRRLMDIGCRFALDDFGIGFSSFSYLQSLPADFVKIDGSFTRGLAGSAANRALVTAIDTVAHTLGKQTIGEAVESLEDAELLCGLGVEYGQGWALGRPDLRLPEPPAGRELVSVSR
jgi:diguanylate cyclase (GGDEF)-like protein